MQERAWARDSTPLAARSPQGKVGHRSAVQRRYAGVVSPTPVAPKARPDAPANDAADWSRDPYLDAALTGAPLTAALRPAQAGRHQANDEETRGLAGTHGPNSAVATRRALENALRSLDARLEGYLERAPRDRSALFDDVSRWDRALQATIQDFVVWRTLVGDDAFAEFEKDRRDVLLGQLHGSATGSAAKLFWPGGGPVASRLASVALGLVKAFHTNEHVTDAKRVNRFLGRQMSRGISAALEANGDFARALTEVAAVMGALDELTGAPAGALVGQRRDLLRLLELPEIAGDEAPSESVAAVAREEIEDARRALARLRTLERQRFMAAAGFSTLVTEIAQRGAGALNDVKLEYVKYKGLGKGPENTPSPASGRERIVVIDGELKLLRGRGMAGNVEIDLRPVQVDGYSGGFAKADTKGTRRPFNALPPGMRASIAPQTVAALTTAARVGVSLRFGTARVGLMPVKRDSAPTRFEELRKGELSPIAYLAGATFRGRVGDFGVDELYDDARKVSDLLSRLWSQLRGRTLRELVGGAQILMPLEDSGIAKRPMVGGDGES